MATKTTFKNLPAYEEGDFILLKNETDGLWYVYHAKSKMKAMWSILPFKQKRDALSYAVMLNSSSIDWNVKNETELLKRNEMDKVYTIMSNIYGMVNV